MAIFYLSKKKRNLFNHFFSVSLSALTHWYFHSHWTNVDSHIDIRFTFKWTKNLYVPPFHFNIFFLQHEKTRWLYKRIKATWYSSRFFHSSWMYPFAVYHNWMCSYYSPFLSFFSLKFTAKLNEIQNVTSSKLLSAILFIKLWLVIEYAWLSLYGCTVIDFKALYYHQQHTAKFLLYIQI